MLRAFIIDLVPGCRICHAKTNFDNKVIIKLSGCIGNEEAECSEGNGSRPA